MFLISVFFCFCIASAINYAKTRKQRKMVANLKGPFSWPLIGALHHVVLLSPRNFFKRSAVYLNKFGTFTRCWIFHRLLIPVADLELAQQLLYSETHLQTGYELLKNCLDDGVLMCKAEEWSQRHQLMVSLFAPKNMLQLEEMCRQHAERLEQNLSKYNLTRQVFDVWQEVAPAMLKLMIATTCGLQTLENCDISGDYAAAVTELTELYRSRFLSLSSANRIIYALNSPFKRLRQKRLIKRINELNQQLIAQLRHTHGSKELVKNEIYLVDRFVSCKLHNSLLDNLYNHSNLNEEQICAELNTFNYMGYLLSSTALCFALVMIARHPNVQECCYKELLAARKHTGWNLQRLPYLEAVLKETLRLYPPQVILGRQLNSPFEYNHSTFGKGSLPQGAEVYINLYELQRNSSLFKAASQFQPERYLENAKELLFSYSMGPRSCPAQDFSLMLLKSLLAPLLNSFELLPYGDTLCLDLRSSIGSSNGFQLALRPRQLNA